MKRGTLKHTYLSLDIYIYLFYFRWNLFFLFYRHVHKDMLLFLLLFIIIILLLYSSHLKFRKFIQLRQEYRTVSFLPVSSIPFIGNVHQLGKNGSDFYRLLHRISSESQKEKKGMFCLWFSIRPIIFLCSGDGLEVCPKLIFSLRHLSFFIS